MILYEFSDREAFLNTAIKLKEQGQLIEVYTPLPEDEFIEKLDTRTPWITRAAIGGALFGIIFGFLLQYIPNVYGYSHNIGGRPLNSWPAFLLVTFEMGILMSALSITGTFFLSNNLPRFDREVLGVKDYNDHRHEHFFILTQKEDMNVKAYKRHLISDAP